MQKWFEREAPHQDIVLSSRIRLARNLSAFPFQNKMTEQQRAELCGKIQNALEHFTEHEEPLKFYQMERLNELERYSMVEGHIVSREFVKTPQNRLLGLSEDESVSVMVNEEDHLRIQVMTNGLNLTGAFESANRLDDVLDSKLDYAFDEKLGFLTTCPTNLGTGLRASVMIHLPALEKLGMINQLTSAVSKLGLTIRGTYGEGSKVLGSIYQISNQITLGITEQDAIQNLESIVLQIIDSEKNARENLMKNKYQLEDMIFRSYGMLKNARLITTREFFEDVSNVRLGVSLGLINDVDCKKLNLLMTLTGTARVCLERGHEIAPQERDYLRAQMIRSHMAV